MRLIPLLFAALICVPGVQAQDFNMMIGGQIGVGSLTQQVDNTAPTVAQKGSAYDLTGPKRILGEVHLFGPLTLELDTLWANPSNPRAFSNDEQSFSRHLDFQSAYREADAVLEYRATKFIYGRIGYSYNFLETEISDLTSTKSAPPVITKLNQKYHGMTLGGAGRLHWKSTLLFFAADWHPGDHRTDRKIFDNPLIKPTDQTSSVILASGGLDLDASVEFGYWKGFSMWVSGRTIGRRTRDGGDLFATLPARFPEHLGSKTVLTGLVWHNKKVTK